jgi:glycosyltransferase involved in cell wall biosynthesis
MDCLSYVALVACRSNGKGFPLKITIVNQFCPPDLSPTARLIASLAQHRAERDDHVTVVGGQGYTVRLQDASETTNRVSAAALLSSNQLSGVDIKHIWTPRLGKRTFFHRCIDYLAFYMLACVTLLRLPQQDVIICLTTPPLIAITGLIHKLFHHNARIILWNMDCYPEVLERAKTIRANGLIYRSISLFNRLVSTYLDHIVCLDPSMRDLLEARNDSKRCPISIIPNWEQIDSFPPPAKVDRKGGNDEQPFTILYSGNMGHGHYFETLLAAAQITKRRTPSIRFVMTGGGVQADTLRQRINKEQLDNIAFEGYVSTERLRIIQQTSHCALITLKDNMLGCMSPSKLHASLAMGLPILYLGPLESNIDDAVNAYQCGISLRQGDTEGLVDTLEMLASSQDIWQGFAKRSRHAFEDHYCDKKNLPLFDAIIDSTSLQILKYSAIKNAA